MEVVIGSARSDERGKLSGGKAGDQNGKEVSTQNFYVHSKGWDVLRAKDKGHREKIADAMKRACDNKHIGYDQNERLGVVKNGTNTNADTEADCSSLVRTCVKEATGFDAGNFTTINEKKFLMNTGLFVDLGKYKNGMILERGDILVTCTKGHTAIVVSASQNYPTLKKNACGANVKLLQTLLNNKGAHLNVDGEFGNLTFIALIEFQAQNGLTKDGICGPKTWEKLLK